MIDLIKLENRSLHIDSSVEKLEKKFLQMPQVECPVVHSFGLGTYIREVRIPADTYSIGHYQNFEHINIFLKGKVSMLQEDGSFKTLTAPMYFIGKPGRKVGYIHEDMIWLNVYSTEEKDIEKLESTFLTKSDVFKDQEKAIEKFKMLQSSLDNEDFEKTIKELGFSKEVVQSQSEDESDMTDLPSGSYKIKVSKSYINGQGLFATSGIDEGELICPARISGKRTIGGRFCNHSINSNAKMIALENGDINLVAVKKISGCFGGFDGEEITINYKDAVNTNLKISEVLKCQV